MSFQLKNISGIYHLIKLLLRVQPQNPVIGNRIVYLMFLMISGKVRRFLS